MSRPGASTATSQRTMNQLALLVHIRKTFGLVAAVLRDARVHWLPKVVFLGSLGTLLLAVLFPETLADTFALFMPVIGPFLDLFGIPAEAGIDWVAFAVAAFNLLRLFPTEIVGEHYDRLFRAPR